jgi:putative oxidoreductase
MLFAHGWNKAAGSGGIEGTARWFEALGLRPGTVHARMAAGTEMAAGAGLTLGVANPLPAAAAIGLMAVAARTDHRGKGFFVFKGGWEYTGVVGVVAAVMAAMGPGRFSVDALRGKTRVGLRWAIFAALFGVASSAALLATSYRPEKKPDDEV